MPLHMIKLCVGVDTVEDLEVHVASRLNEARRTGAPIEQFHVTRVMPKRAAEMVGDGGSLYWVIRGQVQVRQPILRFDAFTSADGIERCRIVLKPDFVRTDWQPRRAFQGWRYFLPDDVPADVGAGMDGAPALPPHLRRELADLGLL